MGWPGQNLKERNFINWMVFCMYSSRILVYVLNLFFFYPYSQDHILNFFFQAKNALKNVNIVVKAQEVLGSCTKTKEEKASYSQSVKNLHNLIATVSD